MGVGAVATAYGKWVLRDGAARVAMRLRPSDPWSTVFDGDCATQDGLRTYHSAIRSMPVTTGMIGYVVTGHRESRYVLADKKYTPPTFQMIYPDWMSALYDNAVMKGPANPFERPSMVVLDGVDHRKLRQYVARYFTPANARAIRDDITEIVDDTLVGLGVMREVDLVSDYCKVIPAKVSAKILGMSDAEARMLATLGDESVKMLEIGRPFKEFSQVERCIERLDTWIDEQFRLILRGRRKPAGLVGILAKDLGKPQPPLTRREAKALLSLLVLAGFETTVNLIGSGIQLLTQHPEQLRILKSEPQHWPNAIDEILRIDGPVLGTVRKANEDDWIGDVRVPRGTFILVSGANHDPSVFPAPYTFDIKRINAKDHITFGGGRHFCTGAHLARVEGEIALSRLFKRFPNLSPSAECTRRTSTFLRGWQSMPMRLNDSDAME
jgi:cytochrome P450